MNWNFRPDWHIYMDLQLRGITYSAIGPDNDRIGGVPVMIDVDQEYLFFNPKFGFSWLPERGERLYFSYARSNREPVRSDFTQPEQLDNFELGYEKSWSRAGFAANAYLMNYKNQLVLTGELNDVGSSIRRNVDESYRAGIELQGGVEVFPDLRLEGNLTLSKNKIAEFTEVIYDYGEGFGTFPPDEIRNTYTNTDLSYSPSVISASVLEYTPAEALSVSFITKYVGRQYLDNTQNIDRSIDPYVVNNLRVFYTLRTGLINRVKFGFLLNNVFNTLYSANGYTFGYNAGSFMVRENYFYPQATRNFLITVEFDF